MDVGSPRRVTAPPPALAVPPLRPVVPAPVPELRSVVRSVVLRREDAACLPRSGDVLWNADTPRPCALPPMPVLAAGVVPAEWVLTGCDRARVFTCSASAGTTGDVPPPDRGPPAAGGRP